MLTTLGVLVMLEISQTMGMWFQTAIMLLYPLYYFQKIHVPAHDYNVNMGLHCAVSLSKNIMTW